MYDEYLEREKNSIRYLGPPHTNGVMALSQMQQDIILASLKKYLNEFTPSPQQPTLSTHDITSMYNTDHPEFTLNGDTVEYLLKNYKDPRQIERENEIDFNVYKNIGKLLDLQNDTLSY
jgi:hypothetical protein